MAASVLGGAPDRECAQQTLTERHGKGGRTDVISLSTRAFSERSTPVWEDRSEASPATLPALSSIQKMLRMGREKQDFSPGLRQALISTYLLPSFPNYTILVPSSRIQGEERRVVQWQSDCLPQLRPSAQPPSHKKANK